MDATVVFRLPDGASVSLTHGDLVGRLETAALHIDDPRVSEAHAMVSLRGAALKLLALRGRITVEGFPVRDVELTAGLALHLAPDFALVVERVILPDTVLGISLGRGGVRVVTGVCSLGLDDTLRSGFVPDAKAWVWPEGASIVVRRAGWPDEVMALGDRIEVDGVALTACAIDMGRGRSFTPTDHGLVSDEAAPLELIARYTSVHIRRGGSRTLVIAGLSARIVSELIAAGVPMPWSALAREIWPGAEHEQELRARWDVTMSRLRKKLVAAGLRGDLVRSDGHGNLELCLGPRDSARDES